MLDDFNGWFGFIIVPPAVPFPEQPHLKKMWTLMCCYTGPLENGGAAFEPLRKFGLPVIDFSGPTRSQRCKACSTGYIRLACSDISAQTSSIDMTTIRRSRCMSNMVRSGRRCTRQCTFT
jgi:hypothetical protein